MQIIRYRKEGVRVICITLLVQILKVFDFIKMLEIDVDYIIQPSRDYG